MPVVTGDAAAATACDCTVEEDLACVLAMLTDDALVNFASELLLPFSTANCTHKPPA